MTRKVNMHSDSDSDSDSDRVITQNLLARALFCYRLSTSFSISITSFSLVSILYTMEMEKRKDITKPRYNKHILPVPCLLVPFNSLRNIGPPVPRPLRLYRDSTVEDSAGDGATYQKFAFSSQLKHQSFKFSSSVLICQFL